MPVLGLGLFALGELERESRVRHYFAPVPDLLLTPLDPASSGARLLERARHEAQEEADASCAR